MLLHLCVLQELASPLNIADLMAAGRATNSTIPVHLYLYQHYDDPWGWNFNTSQELQVGLYCSSLMTMRACVMFLPPMGLVLWCVVVCFPAS
jgi:hypothetical protein